MLPNDKVSQIPRGMSPTVLQKPSSIISLRNQNYIATIVEKLKEIGLLNITIVGIQANEVEGKAPLVILSLRIEEVKK